MELYHAIQQVMSCNSLRERSEQASRPVPLTCSKSQRYEGSCIRLTRSPCPPGWSDEHMLVRVWVCSVLAVQMSYKCVHSFTRTLFSVVVRGYRLIFPRWWPLSCDTINSAAVTSTNSHTHTHAHARTLPNIFYFCESVLFNIHTWTN